MTDPDEIYEAMMKELDELTITAGGLENKEEEEMCLSQEQEDEAAGEIHLSLLPYIEASKSKTVAYENLILQDLEDVTVLHCTEEFSKDFASDFDDNPVKLNEQAIPEIGEQSHSSTDPNIPPALTETEALFTNDESACPNNKDIRAVTPTAGFAVTEELEGDDHLDCERRLLLELRALESAQREQEERTTAGQRAEREKRRREQREKEDSRRLRERHLEDQLRRREEAEKILLEDLEMTKRAAEEKLALELHRQQAVISNLQKQVEEERRAFEEERRSTELLRHRAATSLQAAARGLLARRRAKAELRRRREEQGRREEQLKRTREAEESRTREREEEARRREEEAQEREVRRAEYERAKQEERARLERERRKREEEERRKQEEEEEEEKRRREQDEKRRREEEKRRQEEERRKQEEEEKRRRREEEERRTQEEEEKRREEEERRTQEEEEKRREEEERRTQEEEEKRRQGEERRTQEEEEKRRQGEERRTQEEEEKRRQGEERRTQEEEEKRREEEEKRRSEEEEMRKQKEEKRREEEERRKQEEEKQKVEKQKGKMEGERKKEAEERRKEEERRKKADEEQKRKTGDLEDEEGKKVSEGENKKSAEETKRRAKEVERKLTEEEEECEEGERRANDLQRNERDRELETQSDEKARDDEGPSTGTSSNPNPYTSLTPTDPSSSLIEPSITQTTEKVTEHYNMSKDNTELTPNSKTIGGVSPSTTNPDLRPSDLLSMCLPEHTEVKRLSWMKDCVPWSKLALQNRRKQRGTTQSRRGLRRGGTEVGSLPPLCPETLLQAGGWTSLQEVTTVILEDLPGRSLSTLAQCARLQSLTLRRCGLKALDGLSQCSQLSYIDVQENEITFVDCEKLSNLRILRLGHNRLTSVHGLGGTVNLDVLELSYNSITRIAGLESLKRLQRLSVDHNQLISTRGLSQVYTLLHLDVSHNHLNRVEGLENCALLNTLDLRANNLTEPPCLSNQVLLRQLFLDDNSLSSLDGLTDCWLPLLQELSGAQNSITQLSCLSDCVSLESLDISHNCLSELRNVCESLRGCPLLRKVHLSGNPLLQESNWRATLLRAVPGLRATSGQETDPPPSPPAGRRGSLSQGSFLALCHAQLQQTHHLQQQQIRKLSGASSPLAVLKLWCHHHTEALRLVEEQRYAHEYGDTALPDECRATTTLFTPEPIPDATPELDNTDNTDPVVGEESGALESGTGVNQGYSRRAAERQKTTPPESREEPTPDPLTADLKNCRQEHVNAPSSLTETDERGGEGGGDERPTHTEQSVFNPDRAATAIQALWRGHLLRKRLASALASAIAECSDAGEDDDLEGLDMEEFVFDETELETDWLPLATEDTLPRCPPVSSQKSCPKDRLPVPTPVPTWRLRQAWVTGEEMEPPGQRVSPEKTNRIKSPASTSVPDGLSERSEKILEEWGFSDSNTALMMLKRAQRMTSKKPQQKKVMDPMVRLDIFRNCANHCGPVEARKRPLADKRDFLKGADGEAEPGLAEQMSVNQERTQQWLHSQHAHSESEHFLPEIDADVLIGGRVQLVASPGYRRLWGQTVGLWANNSSVSLPRKERSPPHRNSRGHAKQEVLSPERVTSSPLKKERISFRDNPVQMSGGWGGGKKREKVPK